VWSQGQEKELQRNLEACQKAVHTSLCNNVNTRAALDSMFDLIKAVNIYLAKEETKSISFY